MQYFVRRHRSPCRWDLEGNRFLMTWILCNMAQCAYGRYVGGDDEAVFATFNVGFYGGVWEGDVSEAGHEGNVSTQSNTSAPWFLRRIESNGEGRHTGLQARGEHLH